MTDRPPPETDYARAQRFKPGNDHIWGEGNWIQCPICPHDSEDHEVFHHRSAHGFRS